MAIPNTDRFLYGLTHLSKSQYEEMNTEERKKMDELGREIWEEISRMNIMTLINFQNYQESLRREGIESEVPYALYGF